MSEKNAANWERNARRYDRATLLLNTSFDDMAQAVADAVSGSADVLQIAAGTGLVTRVGPRSWAAMSPRTSLPRCWRS